MYRVLVPVDENEDRAALQVNSFDTLPVADEEIEAHVLYVYEEIDSPDDEVGPTYIDDLNESPDDIEGVPNTVDDVVAAFEERDIDPTVHELVGDPADAILRAADDLDVDAVLLGVRDRSPVGKVVFGSVSQKVILGSPVPVIVAR